MVQEDRIKLGIPTNRSERHASAYIDIHRGRILEDGYMQLSGLSARAFKGTIRVKFINEQVSTSAGYVVWLGGAGEGIISLVQWNHFSFSPVSPE